MATTGEVSGDGSDVRGDVLGQVAWSASGTLLCWLGVLHLGVVLSSAIGVGVLPAFAPVVTAAALRVEGRRALKGAAAGIALLLPANTLVLSAVHMRWEWRPTPALGRQLADLRQAGPMAVALGYFDVPVAERFRTFGVAFDTVVKIQCPAERQLTLMSVCRGYPDAIRICLADQGRTTELQALPHWQWSAEP